jgi:putative methyltransferase
MQYPNARKITYSTCSIHAEENERVVVKALHSPAADGWRILRRNEQVEGLKGWPIRGQLKACKGALDILGADEKENSTRNTDNAATIAEACIRCEKGTKEGTMGFFVAGFVKDDAESTDQEEWRGFSDDESNDTGS